MAPTTTTTTITTTTTTTPFQEEEEEEESAPSFGQRIKCPCENFTALSKIVEILDDDDGDGDDDSSKKDEGVTSTSTSTSTSTCSNMRSLLDWLDGRVDAIALEENKLLSCGKRSRCRFRYGTSFAILNAIRDACRPHLENVGWNMSDASSTSNKNATTRTEVVVEEGFSKKSSKGASHHAVPMTYEEAFPSLANANNTEVKPHPAASNILVPRKKQASLIQVGTQDQPNTLIPKKKNKRRIRPAQVTEPVDRGATNSVWNTQMSTTNIQSTTSTKPWGNLAAGSIAILSSQEPLPVVAKAKAATIPMLVTPVKAKATLPAPMPVMTTPQNPANIAAFSTPTTKGPIHDNVATATPVKKAPPHHLKNLVTIYFSLFRNMLIPSTPLELHLLIRLLVLEGDDATTAACTTNGSVGSFFQPVLTDHESCQRFAVLALTRLKSTLRNLPIPLLQSLLQCEPFHRHCADLTRELNVVLEDYNRKGLLVEYSTETVTGTHAILSLPFDKDRDSRHNYKTQVEVAVYKNREESRDAFLGELRIFMSVKGRVLRPEDMERAQERVRQESRGIMNGLLSVNMMWFAQFFCELLLQVGLAPVQETDQELLNIADRDKLQKLHKRFSSRSTHTSKSSKKISMSQRSSTNSTTTPVDEARLLFPGYQEFFFLFLHQLPFNFGFHLRARMAKTIVELFSKLCQDGLEVQVMKLQLVARFLGYLIFSPNWHEAGIDSSKIQAIELADGLQQLESLGLSLLSQMEQAWGKGQLIITVPWVTELLRMAKWDSLTQTSRQFRQLLAYLRGVQKAIVCEETDSEERFGPSIELVFFYLERFFDETSGLPKLTSLPRSTVGHSSEDLCDCLDKTSAGFSTVLIFASSPHMEDLFSLVEQIVRGVINRSPSKARKLRPSVVSLSVGMEPSKLFGESEKGLLPTPVKDGARGKNESMEPEQSEQRSIETKLVEAFFHQHRDIKGICDFATSQVLRSAPSQIAAECIEPTFEKEGITNDSSEEELARVQTLAFNNARACLERRLVDAIGSGLEIFGPKVLHPRIASIAISLSVARGLLSGQSVLHTLVSGVSKTEQRYKTNSLDVKSMAAKENSNGDLSSLAVSAIEEITSAFDGTTSEKLAPKAADILVLVRQASSCVQNLASDRDRSIPAESSLRAFVATLLQLDRSSKSILEWCRTLPDEEFHSILSALLSLILAIAAVSSYGLKRLTAFINGDLVLRLVETSHDGEQSSHVVQLIEDLVDANMIDLALLADSVGTKKHTGHIGAILSTLLGAQHIS